MLSCAARSQPQGFWISLFRRPLPHAGESQAAPSSEEARVGDSQCLAHLPQSCLVMGQGWRTAKVESLNLTWIQPKKEGAQNSLSKQKTKQFENMCGQAAALAYCTGMMPLSPCMPRVRSRRIKALHSVLGQDLCFCLQCRACMSSWSTPRRICRLAGSPPPT